MTTNFNLGMRVVLKIELEILIENITLLCQNYGLI